jgi:hypothetical protein
MRHSSGSGSRTRSTLNEWQLSDDRRQEPPTRNVPWGALLGDSWQGRGLQPDDRNGAAPPWAFKAGPREDPQPPTVTAGYTKP